MSESRDEFVAGEFGEVEGFVAFGTGDVEAVDAAGFFIPGVAGIEVAEAGVAPVGNVNAAVGAGLDVNGAEPAVGGRDEGLGVGGAEGRGVVGEGAGLHAAGEGHAGDDLAAKLRDCAAFVDEHGLGEAGFVAGVRHVLEPAEGVGIHQRAVFTPAFDVSAALFVVDTTGVAVVGAGEGAAFAVEFEAVGVAAALGEDFKLMGARMVAPDGLAKETDAFDGRGAGAAVRAVEPAVGAPGETIRAGVGVFDAEAGEMHLGVAVGAVGAIAVGIEEKIRRIQDPHAAAAGDDATS